MPSKCTSVALAHEGPSLNDLSDIPIAQGLPTFAELLHVAKLGFTPQDLGRKIASMLGIPNFFSPRGLKLCHQTFGDISAVLDTTFAQSRQQSAGNQAAADRVAVSVLAISTGMAHDTVLRNHFLGKAIMLLHSSIAREDVMALLGEVTHISDTEILLEIARRTSTILDSVELHWDQLEYVEKAACVLSHGTSAALACSDSAIQTHLSRVLEFLLRVVSRPHSTPLSFYHLLGFCATNAGYDGSALIFTENTVDFLVACTQSPHLETRMTGQVSLFMLDSMEQEAHLSETTPGSVRAQQVLAGYHREGQSHQTMCLKGDAQLSRLLERYTSQGDLPEIAKELSNLILQHEFMVRSSLQQDPELVDMTVACAAAVESKTGPTANVLRLALLLSQGELALQQASEFARASLELHPSVAFFYYVLAECHCPESGVASVLLAEKGLECSSMTDFVRRRLLLHSTFSSLRVVSALVGASKEVPRLQEAETLIGRGSRHAKTFVDAAQLDDPDLPMMTALNIVFDILKKGHTLTEDDIQDARERFTFVCDVARCTGQGFHPGVGYLFVTLDKLLDRMPHARSIWGSTVSRQPMKLTPNSISVAAHADPKAALDAWLTSLHNTPIEDLGSQIRGLDRSRRRHGTARLYSCASCCKTSVTLKQCARCQKARYCNSGCQKKHWKYHRAVCKADEVCEAEG
ncbi:hypothetical protein FB45DRAFT_922629 [Roridomyces roridus]|uniref:MYND-type domain-containing protein n=1 Tax=Roridomyces roridus TaxID=1738132 RepID=A0AAD7FKZ4_9AGAR|nr:hypothetical protein FB45DRAFT_922629 [Roridomyces roridus]